MFGLFNKHNQRELNFNKKKKELLAKKDQFKDYIYSNLYDEIVSLLKEGKPEYFVIFCKDHSFLNLTFLLGGKEINIYKDSYNYEINPLDLIPEEFNNYLSYNKQMKKGNDSLFSIHYKEKYIINDFIVTQDNKYMDMLLEKGFRRELSKYEKYFFYSVVRKIANDLATETLLIKCPKLKFAKSYKGYWDSELWMDNYFKYNFNLEQVGILDIYYVYTKQNNEFNNPLNLVGLFNILRNNNDSDLYHILNDTTYLLDISFLGKLIKDIVKDKVIIKNIEAKLFEYKIDILNIDKLNGQDFEKFLFDFFTKLNYKVSLTQHTGDMGVDLILSKKDKKIAVQAKRYTQKVGIKAVQEVLAGMVYYDCNKAMVITTSYFTQNAIDLAKKTKVDLWDRDVVIKKIEKYY